MSGQPWTPHPPLLGPATDRQGLAGVLACHILHSHSEVAHGALAAAEVEAMRVHIEQVPVRTGEGERQRDKRGWATGTKPAWDIGQWPHGRGTKG